MSRKGKVDTIRSDNGQIVQHLRSDIAYLVEEINALKKFVDFIPFTEKPVEGVSILDLFCEIDALQCALYNAIIKDQNGGYKYSIASVATDEPIEVLDRIVSNREAIVKILDTIPGKDWDKHIETGSKKGSLGTVMNDMVADERQVLKKISGQLMTLKS